MLGTSIGDKNHVGFLLFCFAEHFMITWGWMVAGAAIAPCYDVFHLDTAVRQLRVLPMLRSWVREKCGFRLLSQWVLNEVNQSLCIQSNVATVALLH